MESRNAELRSLLSRFNPDSERSVVRFLDGLVDLLLSPAGARATPPERLPEDVRMTFVLRAIWLDVSVGGISKYLYEWDAGKDLGLAIAWCQRVGAKGTAEYLAAVERVFPEGVVPSDDGARMAVLDEWSRRLHNPLVQLDDQYRGAVDEIPSRLAAYFRAAPQQVEDWLQR